MVRLLRSGEIGRFSKQHPESILEVDLFSKHRPIAIMTPVRIQYDMTFFGRHFLKLVHATKR